MVTTSLKRESRLVDGESKVKKATFLRFIHTVQLYDRNFNLALHM